MNTQFSFLISCQDIQKEIAEKLKRQRKVQKLSQSKLAELSGVSLGSLKRFEQTGDISLTSLTKIAFALHLEDDLLHLFEKKSYQSIEEVLNEQNEGSKY
ncbi:MAG: helix-turn-helix transcriptional regulator [Erysipelotrichaceae bacterium]|nr:helix-turn-helix transcriptional regulator [Erysipelotrichaceae bacterium]